MLEQNTARREQRLLCHLCLNWYVHLFVCWLFYPVISLGENIAYLRLSVPWFQNLVSTQVHGDKIVTFESQDVLLSMVAFLGSPSVGVGECHRWLMLLLGTRVQDPQHMEQLKPSPTDDFIAPLHLQCKSYRGAPGLSILSLRVTTRRVCHLPNQYPFQLLTQNIWLLKRLRYYRHVIIEFFSVNVYHLSLNCLFYSPYL